MTARVVAMSMVSMLALPLVAQEASRDTAYVAPIVVSATRTPMSLARLPVAATIITGDELQLRGITTVADALTGMSSAYVAQSGSQGAQTSLFLRGGESKYVKVLVDGVAVNDPGGSYDFGSLTTDNIDRIEIVRGPASVVHGADAVTGVVHVITRRGRGTPRTEIDVRAGAAPREHVTGGPQPAAMQAYDVTGTTSGALTSATYSLALARHQTTGLYELNNQYHNNVLSGRFEFTPIDATEIRVALRYNDYRFNYPTNGGGTVADSNAHRAEDRTVLGVEVERQLTPMVRAALTLSSSVNDGASDDQRDSVGGSSSLIQDKTRRRGAEVRVFLVPSSATALTFGAQMEQQDHRQQLQSQSSFGPFNSSFRAMRRNAGAYAEALFTPTEQLTATIGGRVDDNEQFGRFGTSRVGLSFRPLGATRFRATAGTAFREPTFLENYSSGFATGNQSLEPERTTSWDAGIDQDMLGGRVLLAVTGFSQRFANMIDYDPSDTACGFSYCNVAEATASGIETELRARMWGPISAGVSATFLRTKVIEPGYDSTSGGLYRRGEWLARRPERKVATELTYRGAGRLSASARILAVGVRHDRDFRPYPGTPVTLPSYERVDLGAEYLLRQLNTSRSAVTLRIENLTDRTYQNVFNFLAPRRTVSVGVRSAF